MGSAPTASRIRCRGCGHDEYSEFPRFAGVLWPVTMVLWPLTAVALCVAPSPHSWWPLVVALALTCFRGFGGIAYWGGLKCRGCGAWTMYR